MHRVLALKFAAWLDPAFELWVFCTIDKILFDHYRRLEQSLKESAKRKSDIDAIKRQLRQNDLFAELERLELEERQAGIGVEKATADRFPPIGLKSRKRSRGFLPPLQNPYLYPHQTQSPQMLSSTAHPIPLHLLPELIHIEGGTFDMGSDEHLLEKPIHSVEVPSFHLGKYPVTNIQFAHFLNAYGSSSVKNRSKKR